MYKCTNIYNIYNPVQMYLQDKYTSQFHTGLGPTYRNRIGLGIRHSLSNQTRWLCLMPQLNCKQP